jgi:hypothetical protein
MLSAIMTVSAYHARRICTSASLRFFPKRLLHSHRQPFSELVTDGTVGRYEQELLPIMKRLLSVVAARENFFGRFPTRGRGHCR